jgi:hypothetical protein
METFSPAGTIGHRSGTIVQRWSALVGMVAAGAASHRLTAANKEFTAIVQFAICNCLVD